MTRIPRSVGLALVVGLVGLVGLQPPSVQGIATATTVVVDSTWSAALEQASTIEHVPADIEPPLAGVRDPQWLPVVYEMGCHVAIPDVEPKLCEFGDVDAPTTAVLFGDSHAAQWFPAFDALGAASGIRIVPLTKSGCAAADVLPFNSTLDRAYTECAEWRQKVFALLDAMQPDIVIAAQYAVVDPLGVPAGDRYQAVLDGWISTIRRLAATGADVVVMADTPLPAGDPPACLAAHPDHATACTTTLEQAVRLRSGVEQQAAATVGVRLLDPAPLICGPTTCPVIVDDRLVYRDPSHLTMPFVRFLAPMLGRALGGPWAPTP